MKKLLLMLLAGVLTAGIALAEQKTSNLSFLVLKDANGKPVRNAAVVLHTLDKEGKLSKGGVQLKTDADGQASYDGAPFGRMRVQVLAPGFQTFGEDVDIDREEQEITIKLKRPAPQYSIYQEKRAAPEKKPEGKPKE